MSQLWQDLRFATRMIAKRPRLLRRHRPHYRSRQRRQHRTLLRRPRRAAAPARLCRLPQLVILTDGATPIHVDELRAAARSYTDTGVFSSAEEMSLTGSGEPEVIHAQRVSANFLSILGVAPALGRGFLPAEDRIGGPNVVMLNTRLWRRRFGANPNLQGMELSRRVRTAAPAMPMTP
jgi:MacB-like periplasmic core domain